MLRQPYHLVEYSPWPLTSSMAALSLTSALISWFHMYSAIPLALSIILTLITMYQWWRDVTRESTFMGHHTSTVTKGLRLGMILFIASEVAFFFSFFWAFFHSSLAPVTSLGSLWPPTGISPIDPFSVPLLNTAVLLASGMTITWAHHSILSLSEKDASKSLMLTISLGAYFTFLQMEEYAQSPFSIADSIYGTTFFVATGFHGLHVIIGSSFLMICLLRNSKLHNSQLHHFGFEAAAWYWHFVDVVWILLFICIYWWGS